MKTLLTITASLALAVPAAFAVPPDASPSSAQLCKQQRQGMKAADFASLYAPARPKSAFGKCVSRQSHVIETADENAAKACTRERGTTSETIATFNDTYGKNENDRNAFGKCVSQKAKHAVESVQAATLKAAKACKGMRASDAGGFATTYGQKKNAFGKCVSKTAKGQSSTT